MTGTRRLATRSVRNRPGPPRAVDATPDDRVRVRNEVRRACFVPLDLRCWTEDWVGVEDRIRAAEDHLTHRRADPRARFVGDRTNVVVTGGNDGPGRNLFGRQR